MSAIPWTDPQLTIIIDLLNAAGVPKLAGRTALRVQWLVEAWAYAQQRDSLANEIANRQQDAIEELQERIKVLRRELDAMGGDSAQVLLDANAEKEAS